MVAALQVVFVVRFLGSAVPVTIFFFPLVTAAELRALWDSCDRLRLVDANNVSSPAASGDCRTADSFNGRAC